MKLHGKNEKGHNAQLLCYGTFFVCLGIRMIEFLCIRTDQSILGENLFHKICGILILVVILHRTGYHWRDIGFRKEGLLRGILRGCLLGAVCFAVSFGAELAVLQMIGQPAHLEWYVSSFSITGMVVKQTGGLFVVGCILCNGINVWMEEGLFRGWFLQCISERFSFGRANLTAALLFGVWHWVMPLRSWLDGELSMAMMLLMGIGYLVLAGMMSIKWGFLYRMQGNLWMGIGDHFFNNAIASNLLHVVNADGADPLQIVRIMMAQLLSFAFVAILYYRKFAKPQRDIEQYSGDHLK